MLGFALRWLGRTLIVEPRTLCTTRDDFVLEVDLVRDGMWPIVVMILGRSQRWSDVGGARMRL